MPLYEYKCDACGEMFEVMQKFSDEPLATHDKCGGRVQRVLSAPALQFKGSGWYITDYAKSGKAPANGSSSKTEGSSTPPASSGSESTAAPAASESKTTSSDTK